MVTGAQDVLKELTETLQRANRILAKIENGQGTLGALIKDKKLYNQALKLMGARPKDNYLKNLVDKSR